MRIIITTSDIQQLTGKSQRTACRIIQTIRDCLNKKPHQEITIYEYAEYSGIPLQIIQQHIK